MKRLGLVLLLPLLALDCLVNMLIGGSFQNTLSGEAWQHREHKYWKRAHRAIDALFFWQTSHCKFAAVAEAIHGSAWKAWRYEWDN